MCFVSGTSGSLSCCCWWTGGVHSGLHSFWLNSLSDDAIIAITSFFFPFSSFFSFIFTLSRRKFLGWNNLLFLTEIMISVYNEGSLHLDTPFSTCYLFSVIIISGTFTGLFSKSIKYKTFFSRFHWYIATVNGEWLYLLLGSLVLQGLTLWLHHYGNSL